MVLCIEAEVGVLREVRAGETYLIWGLKKGLCAAPMVQGWRGRMEGRLTAGECSHHCSASHCFQGLYIKILDLPMVGYDLDGKEVG